MDVNFLSDDRRRREEEERQRLAGLPLLPKTHAPEPFVNSNSSEHGVAAPVPPVVPVVEPPVASVPFVLPRPHRVEAPQPSVVAPKPVTPVVEKKAPLPAAVLLGRTPTPPQSPRATFKPIEPTSPRAPRPQVRLVGRIVEYAALISLVVVVFVSGFAVGISARFSQPVAQPVVVQEVDAEHAYALAEARDRLRLAHVMLLQQSLDEYWRLNEAHFPAGTDVVLGSVSAQCLGASGWVSRDRCALPANPAENRIYLSSVPVDPSAGVYYYSVLENGRAYRLRYTLEVGVDGVEAGEQARTGGAVPQQAVALP